MFKGDLWGVKVRMIGSIYSLSFLPSSVLIKELWGTFKSVTKSKGQSIGVLERLRGTLKCVSFKVLLRTLKSV